MSSLRCFQIILEHLNMVKYIKFWNSISASSKYTDNLNITHINFASIINFMETETLERGLLLYQLYEESKGAKKGSIKVVKAQKLIILDLVKNKKLAFWYKWVQHKTTVPKWKDYTLANDIYNDIYNDIHLQMKKFQLKH